MLNGDLDIGGLLVDLNFFFSDISEFNCFDGMIIKLNFLICGKVIVFKILERNYNLINIWIMYFVVW